MKYTPPIGAPGPNDPYVDGNPLTGTEASTVPAASIEAPQREIENAIIAAGLTPNAADMTQLTLAILAMISANTPFASNAESNAGISSSKALTPSNFGSQQSKTQNGYLKLPGGLILQWGRTAAVAINVVTTVTLPVSFPNGGLFVVGGAYLDNYVSGGFVVNTYFLSNSQIKVTSDEPSSTTSVTAPLSWFAIGY